jgi:hypothetical protein
MIPWLLAGGATLAVMVTLAVYRMDVLRYRQRTAASNPRGNPEICFFLHERNVMNLYLQGEYPALKREYEERTRSSQETGLNARVRGIGEGHAGREREEETVIKYIKDEGTLRVIGRLIRALEDANRIVYVNLFTTSFEPGRGLDGALSSPDGRRATWRRSARLRDLNPFTVVSIMGRFQVTDRNDKTTTFSAPYGDPTDPASEPRQVSVTCVAEYLEDVPAGPFPARCLGRIQKWDPDNQKLVIDPVFAIFR